MKKGFTLIELMIVVAIIAIIAAIAIPSLLRSRMAANETAAAAGCKAFAEAEEIYRRTDYDADGLLEYSQTIGGPRSLVDEVAAGDGKLGLLDRTFATAEGAAGTPKAGYLYAVLNTQGAAATGGARTYLAGVNMTLGYACNAAPGAWDGTGRNQFLINNNGTIFQKDTGNNTFQTYFNPDTTWAASE
jgi:type IV pilus assembly protein PilA